MAYRKGVVELPLALIVTHMSGGGKHHFHHLQWTANDVKKGRKDLISYRKVDDVYC